MEKLNKYRVESNSNELFCCYECGENLQIFDDCWKCLSCKEVWTVDEDGVVLMNENDYFFGADQKSINRLLDEIRTMNLEQLLDSVDQLEKKYSDFEYDYCLNPRRADWTLLGDFHNKVILDVGCGYGTISMQLSKRAKKVIAIDGTLERIKFLSIIKKLMNVQNIIPIHGNITRIPVESESIDSALMIGVLEYAGMFGGNGSPKSLQLQFLRYLFSLLSDVGELWVGIENKLSPSHFLGKTSHGDLPFTPLLPTKLAGIITRMIKGESYRLRLYSEWGYRSLFKQAGFNKIEFYYPFFDYKLPLFIASSRQHNIISHYLENFKYAVTWKGRIAISLIAFMDKFNLAGLFAPAFFIKAIKS